MHAIYCNRRNNILLSRCRPRPSVDPVLWLPMTRMERSRCIRWRLGWLPGGKPRSCPRCANARGTTRTHLIECLNLHIRLNVDPQTPDPISYVLNMLPMSRPNAHTRQRYWTHTWPILCDILDELESIHHPDYVRSSIYRNSTPGQDFVEWLLPPTLPPLIPTTLPQ
ncbi:hypothetical protein BX666DRAFT_1870800 [Dichotomocladium elegans]|nr:hypothetical protein BX666DRAFT_1870800 [Dichotomocladium elegans]